jgi:hypothetical protein
MAIDAKIVVDHASKVFLETGKMDILVFDFCDRENYGLSGCTGVRRKFLVPGWEFPRRKSRMSPFISSSASKLAGHTN